MPKHYCGTASGRLAFLGLDETGTEFWLSGPHIISTSGGARRRPTCFVCSLAHSNRCRRRRRPGRKYASSRKGSR